MGKEKVVIPEPIHESGVALLRGHDLEVTVLQNPRELPYHISNARALLLRTLNLGRDMLEWGMRLKVIARHGTGYDNIDIETANYLRIPVVYAPGANADAVAEHTLALILCLSKRLPRSGRAVREGAWNFRLGPPNLELKGRTLGVIGCGRVGSRVVRLARALGMRALVYDPYVRREVVEAFGGIKVERLPALLSGVDILSIHCTLTPETRGMLGEEELRLMRKGSYLVNTARGAVVDGNALAAALMQGRLGGAALDVLDPEPPEPDDPLLSLDNVILTPHMAGSGERAAVRMAEVAAQGIIDVLSGRRPEHCANPQVLDELGIK